MSDPVCGHHHGGRSDRRLARSGVAVPQGQLRRGGYVEGYPFTSVNGAQTTDDIVALNYKDGRNVCTACTGPTTTVRYQWQNDHVAMLDPAPTW
nr:LppP/LprE family lipoprotein [Mycobacterium szulgai]